MNAAILRNSKGAIDDDMIRLVLTSCSPASPKRNKYRQPSARTQKRRRRTDRRGKPSRVLVRIGRRVPRPDKRLERPDVKFHSSKYFNCCAHRSALTRPAAYRHRLTRSSCQVGHVGHGVFYTVGYSALLTVDRHSGQFAPAGSITMARRVSNRFCQP